MRRIIAVVVFAVLHIHLPAQKIKFSNPLPEVSHITRCIETPDRYYLFKFNRRDPETVYITDKSFKIITSFAYDFDSDHKWIPIGNSLYGFATKYNEEDKKLNFLYKKLGEPNKDKIYHSGPFTFTAKDAYISDNIKYIVSEDQQKITLIWQQSTVPTLQYSVVEFDTSFRQLAEHKIDAGIALKDKEDIQFFADIDNKGNLVMLVGGENLEQPLLINYSLSNQEKNKKAITTPDGYRVSWTTLDKQNSVLYFFSRAKYTGGGAFSRLPAGLDLNADIGKMFTYDIQNAKIKEAAIHFSPSEVDSLKASKGKRKPDGANRIESARINLLGNGTCALLISMCNLLIIHPQMSSVPGNNFVTTPVNIFTDNNIMVRTFNTDGIQVKAQTLFRALGDSRYGENMYENMNGGFIYFCNTSRGKKDIPALRYYRMDKDGKIDHVIEPIQDDVRFCSSQQILSTKIPLINYSKKDAFTIAEIK